MSSEDFWRTLVGHARKRGAAVALDDGHGHRLDYAGLLPAVARVVAALQHGEPRAIGLAADNGLAWALVNLAALAARIPLVPLPGFFTPEQLVHVARDAGLERVLTDAPDRWEGMLGARPTGRRVAGLTELSCTLDPGPRRPVDAAAARITFTSGTTGAPKGVLLPSHTLLTVADSLRDATGCGPHDTHVAVLPLSLLLEDVGGVLRGLLAGARVVLPPLADVGLTGSSSLDGARLVQALREHGATSTILVPEMLSAMLEHGRVRPADLPRTLRFAGVGGARVPLALLREAAAAGLAVYEGYGLTEAGSVVALNTPAAHRPGSAGRPLRHVRVELADDGEILVSGTTFMGTLGGDGAREPDAPWATGDLGHLDEDGFLHVFGRKRNVLVTSFGRNVSPEWVESELRSGAAVAQAAVIGDGRAALLAVLVPRPGHRDGLAAAVETANARLPDYARLGGFVVTDEPFTRANGLLTRAGTPDRAAIGARFLPSRRPIPTLPSGAGGRPLPRTG